MSAWRRAQRSPMAEPRLRHLRAGAHLPGREPPGSRAHLPDGEPPGSRAHLPGRAHPDPEPTCQAKPTCEPENHLDPENHLPGRVHPDPENHLPGGATGIQRTTCQEDGAALRRPEPDLGESRPTVCCWKNPQLLE